jgi:hypothetical protein
VATASLAGVTRLTSLLAGGLLLLTGCSGAISDDDGRAYVDRVRTTVPSAESYPDDQLLTMAATTCEVGSKAAAVPKLRAYGGLTDADRRRIARLALRTACPADD